MSLDDFRSQVLSNSCGEERVEVNQRHLIDKILARYSAKFTVFRELMQNSDDAKSSSVQIIFETANPSTDKKLKDNITRILFKNNGFAFRGEDWNRLKKIAEGNPDEQKIGAFGVGFYSLFSMCEEPFVSSGGQGMAFYWRGNQLFARQGPIDDEDQVWTTFLMDMREPMEFPDIEEFARFLANALGFTGNLRNASVYFNDTLVIQLSKDMQQPKSMSIPSSIDTFSPQKLFQLTSVDVRNVQLGVKRLFVPTDMSSQEWRSLPITRYQTEETSIFLKIASGNLNVKVSDAFSAEMERSTKKKPPGKTTIQIIFTGYDELRSSRDDDNNISPVFEGLLTYPGQGKIYIGFPTYQTTGCCSHLAARVIPTVERESIDLADKTLAKYNSEMLCLAGTLCRITYEDEMAQITKLYNDTPKTKTGSGAKTDADAKDDTKTVTSSKTAKTGASTKTSNTKTIIKGTDTKTTKTAKTAKTGAKTDAGIKTGSSTKTRTDTKTGAGTKIRTDTKTGADVKIDDDGADTKTTKTDDDAKSGADTKTNDDTETGADTKTDDNAEIDENIAFHEWLEKRAAHALAHFTFKPSTPNEQVGIITESQFFNCTKNQLSILSSNGVLPMSSVRISNSEMVGFIKMVPVVPNIIMERCVRFFMRAKDMKLIKELTLQDVLYELKSRVLSEDEIVVLLKWWITYRSKGNSVSQSEFAQFMQLTRVGKKFRGLNTICYFLNPGIIPPNMDIPAEVLPYTISKNLKKQDLEKWFKWSEFSLVNWAKFIVDKPNLETKPPFAKKVHQILAKNLNNISQSDKGTIRQLFVEKKCIPTKFGMKLPNEAYFQNVNLFPDLPTIEFQKPSSVQNLMELFGVRKVVELQLIFDRLVDQGSWDHMQLVKYLASMSDSLKENEMKILKETPIWPKENLGLRSNKDKSKTDLRSNIGKSEETKPDLQSNKGVKRDLRSNKGKSEEVKLDLRSNKGKSEGVKRDLRSNKGKSEGIKRDLRSNKGKSEGIKRDLRSNKGKSDEIKRDLRSNKDKSKSDLRNKDKSEEIKQDLRSNKGKSEEIKQDLQSNKDKSEEIKRDLQSNKGNSEEIKQDLESNKDHSEEIKQDLQSEEIKPEPKIQRFVARELYAPTAIHCEFGLPLLSWKGKWIHNTQEGKFLIKLGLQEYPSLKKILELVTPSTNPDIRSKAFKYFVDNFKEKYSIEYNLTKINTKFLPCTDPNIYAKPSECFINLECMIMKFQVIQQDLRYQAEQFGVQQHPNRKKLLDRLIEDPPQDENKAKQIFEYLASRQGDFIESDWKILADLKFIPIQDKVQDKIILVNPRSCFIKDRDRITYDYFTYVDFGSKANKFLQSCEVKREPSPIDFAELLVKSSHELYENGTKKYLIILEKIAMDFNNISKKSSLVAEMMNAPILLAEDKRNKRYNLATAKEIFINDDTVYQLIFNPFIAPEERLIEGLYKKLGCRSLHESVKESSIPRGIVRITEDSQKLQNKIIERTNLFYYDHPECNIRRGEEWLKKLQVREINNIETSYILEAKVITENTSACILQDVLYVTSEPDLYAISQQLSKIIYKSCKLKDTTCLNTLLTTQLLSLERMGYPVDRILRDKSKYVANKYQTTSSTVRTPINIHPGITQNLRISLRNAIKACHTNLGNDINSLASAMIFNETKASYCEIIPGHLLYCVGTIQEIEIYDSKGANQSEILSQSYAAQLKRFINVLKDLAEVFELSPKAIHIFYDNYTGSIAFNRDSSLFFNFKFYLGLHDKECRIKPTSDAMAYWFMTFCHELAHNFTIHHNSEHEHYFSSFAEIYMSKFLEVIKKRGI